MNNIIILDHKGGRLCNQLWNYISVYAYCLNRGYRCLNYSFYTYNEDFDIKDKDLWYRFFILINKVTRLIGKNRFAHKIFRQHVINTENKERDRIINSGIDFYTEGVFYLPPSDNNVIGDVAAIDKLENSKSDRIYLEGWLFRNPIGIEKYRQEIKKYFAPKKYIRDRAESLVNPLRKRYKHIIGVHIRQGDYKGDYLGAASPAAKIYFNEEEANKFIREYLNRSGKKESESCFIICSDESINTETFKDLNVVVSNGTPVQDMHTLTLTDLIIGTNSTFGAYASYYGNVPFVVFDKNGLDWEYYHDKNKYFENKYCKVVYY